MAKTIELRRHFPNDGDVLSPEGVKAAVKAGKKLAGPYQMAVVMFQTTVMAVKATHIVTFWPRAERLRTNIASPKNSTPAAAAMPAP